MLGLSHEAAHDGLTRTPKSLILRARQCFRTFESQCTDHSSETRLTYRAVLSEPTVVIPRSSEIRFASVGTSGLRDESQNQLIDRLPAKRPHEPDDSKTDVVADLETGSKKRKKKRIKGQTNS
jgi:hypothetical protein